MKADPAAQLKLLELQSVDTDLAQLRHRRTSLPEHAEIARLMTQRKQLLEEMTASQTRVSDLERTQRKAETDLEPVCARKVRNQERVDSGAVDAKALQSLVDEIAHLAKRISDLEDAELEVMEALENERETVTGLTGRRQELEQQIKALMVTRDEQVGDIDSRLGARERQRSELVAELPEQLVKVYTKVAGKHAGSGAAELKQRRCQGCRLEINAADLRAYAAAAPDEVLRCEECGRILVRTAQSGL